MGLAIKCRKKTTAAIVLLIIFGYLSINIIRKYDSEVSPNQNKRSMENQTGCPGVLSHMMRGYWKPYPDLLRRQLLQILQEQFLIRYRLTRGIPKNLSRPDGKCGFLSFQNTKFGKYRALCDPTGPTPCCYDDRCMYKTMQECRCNYCYDVRQRITAESSVWVPSNPRCPVTDFDSETACRILDRSTIFFGGNSFLRQVFMTLTMILRGDLRHALIEPQKVDELCDGLDNMTGPCQFEMEKRPVVCNGRVNITFFYGPSANHTETPLQAIEELKLQPRTMIFLGIGIHDNYDYEKVYSKYIARIWKYFKNQNASWPKFLWASTHAVGLLKSPHVTSQSNKAGKYFNDKLKPRLVDLGIPIFDTFNMTDGVVSPDGCHHGLTVNMLKARFFLHYIDELQRNGQW